MRGLALLVLGVALAAPVAAQAQEPAPLTPVERLELQNAALRATLQQQAQEALHWFQAYAQAMERLKQLELQVQRERDAEQLKALVAAIEAARPGFTLDLTDGTFQPKKAQ